MDQYPNNLQQTTQDTIPPQYKPLSPWAYFGYNILFSIPLIGFIFLIIFSLDNSNINRRNFARSFWCVLVVVLIVFVVVFGVTGAAIGGSALF